MGKQQNCMRLEACYAFCFAYHYVIFTTVSLENKWKMNKEKK